MSARKITLVSNVRLEGSSPLPCHSGLFVELSVPEEELAQLCEFIENEFDFFSEKIRNKLNEIKVPVSKPVSNL